ncbi:MAG: hypothetical protein JNL48_13215 [Acidobacteria bacterium]|nr:hypothetical protein [Acidobacteriota bacterium]
MMTRRIVCAAALLMAAGVPARAQSPVYLALPAPVSCLSSCDAQLLRVDADGPAVTDVWTLPASGAEGGLFRRNIQVEYVTPDGGLVVWLEPRRIGPNLAQSTLGLLDLARSAGQVGPLSPSAYALVGHPRRPEIYFTGATGPLALGPAGTRALAVPPACASTSPQPLVVSADGRRVLFSCTPSATSGDAFVVDTDSGALIGSRAISGVAPVLSVDGADLYTVENGLLRRYGAGGGAVLAETALPLTVDARPELIRSVQVDPRSGHVFAFGLGVHVFEATTLQLVRSVVGFWADLPGGVLTSWTFDPILPRAYVTASASTTTGTPSHAYWTIDTAQLSTVWSYQIVGPLAAGPGRFVIAPRPAAPVSLSASTVGSTVTLAWAHGTSNATVLRHVLEVGSAPGLNDIIAGLDVGLQTSFAASGVPPGRYHVRVRAGNSTGLSAPSNEVVVQVP